MKNMIRIVFSFMIAAFLFASCDEIEQPYLRDGNVIIDTSACPVPDFPALPNPVQKVLLEDFTGHTCVNCPGAAEIAHDLIEQHGGNLILMTIHAGWFAQTGDAPYDTDLTCEDGTAIDNFFEVGLQGNPNGMINRMGYDQEHVIGPANWASKVDEGLAETPVIILQLITEYDSTERKLCTHARASFLEEMQEDLNIAVFITESGIISAQKNNDPLVGPTPDILDYEHSHVLRDGIAGAWGNALTGADTTTATGHQIIRSWPYTISTDWVAENCQVVVYVYRTNDYSIVQVEEAKVVTE